MADQQFEYGADGKKYACSFKITGRGKNSIVEVTTPWGKKSTQVGGSPASVIAKMMARELYKRHIELN